MDYKKCVIEDLKNFKAMKKGYENNVARVREIENSLAKKDITERERRKLNIKATGPLLERIEAALDDLPDIERRVVDAMYIQGEHRAVETLCRELRYEKTHIYRIKDRAIHRLALTMYGIAEL